MILKNLLKKKKKRIYLHGSNGETDIENRLVDMGRGEERVRNNEKCKTILTECGSVIARCKEQVR